MTDTPQHRVAKHRVRLLQDLRSDVLRGTPSRGLNFNLLRRRKKFAGNTVATVNALADDKSLVDPKLT